MAVERLYFRDTQTQANTGGEGQGSRWDLDPTAGSPATLDGLTNNNNTPVLLLAWHRTVGADVAAATFPVSLAVTAITNSPAFYLRAARYASDGTLADAGADGTLRTTTGTFTETLSLATTWDAGDQLVIELWGYRNAGHSASVVTIGVNQAGSYVDADLEAAAEPVLFAGAAIGSSATAGALSPLALLAGAAIGSSATSGVLAIEEPAPAFEGAAVGSSTARGALSPAQELEGAAAGSSAASGALSPRLALLGSSVGSSSSAGALSPSAALEGAAVGASSSAGELAAIAAFSGAAVGSSSGFGDLSPELETLSGRAIGSATAAGALSPASSLEGSALGSSAAAG
ncbi:hypothetical protein, partial [Natronococcus sp.]|uniref:hypothetical protein n=1 Tax=Natronococcus sp. TaxID=35747 RepID=UPI003A4DB05A